MKAALRITLLGVVAAATIASGIAARIANRIAQPIEVRRDGRHSLTEEQRQTLTALDDSVLLTYVVSPEAELPGNWLRSAREVERVLQRIEAAAPKHIRTQVLRPSDRPELAYILPALGIQAQRTLAVARDALVERELYSTLHVARGVHPSALLEGIGPDQLPHLVDLILGLITQAKRARAPRIALVAPAKGFDELREHLRRTGELIDVDAASEWLLPIDADLLFCLDVPTVSAEQTRAIEDHLRRGRSAVISIDAWQAASAQADTPRQLQARASPFDDWLAGIGISVGAAPLYDERCVADPATGAPPRPNRIASVATQQDFRSLRSQPNGSLVFENARALSLRPAILNRREQRAHVLATTSASSWIDPAASLIDVQQLQAGLPATAQLTAHAALAIHVESAHALEGDLCVLSTATALRDGSLTNEAFAHKALLDVLLHSFASVGRRVRSDAIGSSHRARVAPSSMQRIAWRAVFWIVIPLGWLSLRLARRREDSPRVARFASVRRFTTWAAVATLALLLARLTPRLEFDWTRAARHSLPPSAATELAALTAAGPIQLELFRSPRSTLPPKLRPLVSGLRERLARFASSSAGIEFSNVVLSMSDARAEEHGLSASIAETVDGAATHWQPFLCSLRSVSGRGEKIIRFETEADFEELDLRVLHALQSSYAVKPLRVAFAGEKPSLSPAEVRLDYEAAGLFAPGRGDVFGAARSALERIGFDVVRVDPDRPVLPDSVDVLVWLSPRRDASPMLTAATDYLARGGRALIAAQHFEVQHNSQLKRDASASAEHAGYWPRPLYPDVDAKYFHALGVELQPRIVFDELNADLPVASADAAAPPSSFAIKLVPANHGSCAALRGVGDLRFISPSPLRLDPSRLATHDLLATPLLNTSERSWSYEWRGGNLPKEILQDQKTAQQASANGLDGIELAAPRNLLAVDMTGTFPAWSINEDGQMRLQAPTQPVQGRVMLLSAATMFRDDQLRSAGFAHDRLLVALVSELGLGESATQWLSRSDRSGFDFLPSEDRLSWRLLVIGLLPSLMALLMAGITLRRYFQRGGRA
ncbi:MAG: hypothetical protein ACI841_002399 [Planctomycetota bacterium]